MSAPAYSLAERDRRWNLARKFMEQQGVDGLIVFGEHEDAGPAPYCYDNWFTNDRPGSTVVFPRMGRPIVLTLLPACVVDHFQATDRGEKLWILPEDIRVGRHAAALTAALREKDLSKSTIGVLGLEPFIPLHPEGVVPFQLWHKVLTENPEATFKSVGEDFARLIMPLSDEEVAVVRHAAKIGDSMAEAMVMAARPGSAENEIVRAAIDAAHAEGTVVPMLHLYSGPTAINWGQPRWTYSPQARPRILQNGDVITSEVFCNFGMRATQLQVSIAIGEVHQDVDRASKVARECYEAGLNALRPGVKFGDVAQAMRKPLHDAGGWSKGPQIHSLNPIFAICGLDVDLSVVGVSDKYPRIRHLDTLSEDLIIELGMTFAFEPSCAFGSRGVTIGGTVVVGQDGPIELNPDVAKLFRTN